MSTRNDNDYNEKDIERNHHLNESNEDKIVKSSDKPWNNKFGENENLKNRQYSRTARNQPVKEASRLSQVLLGLITVIVLIPFILFGVIQAKRGNEEIASRTTDEIMIERNKTSEEEKTIKETTEEKTTEEVTALPALETTEAAVAQESQAPQQTQAQQNQQSSGKTHTVNAGESWYGIARSYGVDVYTLASHNGSSIDTPIHPGTVVNIP